MYKKSILTLPRSRGLILCERLYRKTRKPEKPEKDTFKEKGKSEENRYFVREHAEQFKNLRDYLSRIEKSQEKLKHDLDETSRLLEEIQNEEQEAEEQEAEEKKKKKKEKEKRWK